MTGWRSLSLLLVVAGSALAGCVEVAKLDPGPFVIDDFDDGDLWPRSKGFGMWTCDRGAVDTADAGSAGDASTEGGAQAAADDPSSVTCARDPFGEHGCCGLAAKFDLQPDALGQQDDARVLTNAPVPVNFTRFRTFVFSSIVEAPGELPSGTDLFVELGCSRVQRPAASSAHLTFLFHFGRGWSATRLDLSTFMQDNSGSNQNCLVQVDSVRFIVRPGSGQAASGTLHIDNVYLLE